MESVIDTIRVRPSTASDLEAIVQFDYQSSVPPFERSFYEELLVGTDSETLAFLEAVFRCGANRWGGVDDFVVLEVNGAIAAGCAVFLTDAATARKGPFDLDRLPEISRQLGWSDAQAGAFVAAYDRMFLSHADFLVPQADAIVESVAVFPEFRGRGLGRRLVEAAQERARQLGARTVGIMAIHGNDAALRLYEQYFQPYISYHAEYFDREFPGITKFRAALA